MKGAARTDVTASLPTDDIYITPRLIAEGGPGDEQRRESDLIRKIEDQDLDPESRMRLEVEYAEITGKRFRIGDKRTAEGRPAPEVVASHRHMVILGSPGVGKSAFMRFLARACALGPDSIQQRLGWAEDAIPIVIPLAAFADARRKDAVLTLRAYLDHRMEERGGQALRSAVSALLADGRALVLLDGIDEVPESSARASVVRAVDRFRSDHILNRIVITSRPVGYVRVAGEIRHFILPNFSPQQVDEFVLRWQRAREYSQRPTAPDLQLAEKDAREMLAEIRLNPKVAELATNPLILVIVSLIRREGRRLPDKRVQLYQRAVETLMETWNQFRSLSEQTVGGQMLPVDRLIRVWGAVASWSRATRPTGVMHRGELKRELVRILTQMEFDEDSPEATAESYLEAAARNAGILEERGTDIFAFWHPTFEEYLAGVDLTTPAAKAVERLISHADDPRWREVILLGIGYVGLVQSDGETATEIVRAILDTGRSTNPLEPVLHRRLRLAAACIADDVGVKRNLAQEVIVRLGGAVAKLPYGPLTTSFVQTVRALPRMRPSDETVSGLQHLETHPAWEVRIEAARLFSNAAAVNREARDLCLRLVADSDADVRCSAALGLARAGEYSAPIWTKLRRSLYSPFAYSNSAVRDFFGSAPATAWFSLRSLLSANEFELRYGAADLLCELGRADEVLNVLRSWVSTGNVEHRCEAAKLLVRLDRADGQVVNVLRSWLSASNLLLRHEAAELLVRLDRVDEQVVNVLRSLLLASEPQLLFNAAELLEKLGQAHEQVVNALRSWLFADKIEFRYRAAELLGKLGRTEEVVVDALGSLLSTDDPRLRFSMAELLEKLGRADERVVSALHSLLLADDQSLRFRAARLLEKLGRADEQVISVLQRILLVTDDRLLRLVSAGLLEKLGHPDEQVISRLRSWLSADSPQLRAEAVELIAKLGQPDQQVLSALIGAIDCAALDAITACRKLCGNTWPSEHEAKSLATLLISEQPQPDREWLFSWVEAKCNAIQQAQPAPAA